MDNIRTSMDYARNPSVRNGETPTGLNVDSSDFFCRTALVIAGEGSTVAVGSVDILDGKGNRVAQLNISLGMGGDWFNVDVIDVDEVWQEKALLHFTGSKLHKERIDNAHLGCVEFKRGKAVK